MAKDDYKPVQLTRPLIRRPPENCITLAMALRIAKALPRCEGQPFGLNRRKQCLSNPARFATQLDYDNGTWHCDECWGGDTADALPWAAMIRTAGL